MEEELKLIKNELRLLRQVKNLSVKEMCTILKISQTTYRGYEISGKVPTHIALRIYRKFGYNLIKHAVRDEPNIYSENSDSLSILIKIQQLVDLLKILK